MIQSEYPPLPPVLDRLLRKSIKAQNYIQILMDWVRDEQDRRVVAAEIRRIEDQPRVDPHPREASVGDWISLFRSMEDRARMAHRQAHTECDT